MACTDLNNYFVSEANRLSSDTMYRNWATSPWDTEEIVPKTRWPDGMSASPNFLVFERSMPLSSAITFQTYGFNDGGVERRLRRGLVVGDAHWIDVAFKFSSMLAKCSFAVSSCSAAPASGSFSPEVSGSS